MLPCQHRSTRAGASLCQESSGKLSGGAGGGGFSGRRRRRGSFILCYDNVPDRGLRRRRRVWGLQRWGAILSGAEGGRAALSPLGLQQFRAASARHQVVLDWLEHRSELLYRAAVATRRIAPG